MVGRIIEFCAKHRMLVFVSPRSWSRDRCTRSAVSARRHPGSVGSAGDRVHRVDGPRPDLVEDQVTTVVSSLLASPKVQAVRGQCKA